MISSRSSLSLLFLFFLGPGLATSLQAQKVPAAILAKLDKGIEAPEEEDFEDPAQILVRFKDQLFASQKSYDAFCKKNNNGRRRSLRTGITADLKQRSDASFKKIEKLLASLGGTLDQDEEEEEVVDEEEEEETEEDDLSDSVDFLKRYWIINAVGCTATYKACLKIAAHPEVAFIYKNPAPHRLAAVHNASHLEAAKRFRGLYGRLRQRREEMMEEFTTMWDKGRAAEAKGFNPTRVEVPWNLQQIGADKVWKQEKVTGKGILVGVMDTGCLPSPALVNALWRNPKEKYDGEDTDGNGFVDDVFGYDFLFNNGVSIGELMVIQTHGSHCAGIVAGRPFEVAKGRMVVTGVAPESKVMILRGLGQLTAFEYALVQGVDVMSMSFGFIGIEANNWRGIYRQVFNNLTAAGMVLVGAAGNSGPKAKVSRNPLRGPKKAGLQIPQPNDSPAVITVGGVSKKNEIAGASSRGPVRWDGVKFFDDFGEKNPLRKPDLCAYFGGFPCWTYVVAGMSKRENFKIIHHLDDAIGLVRGPEGTSFANPHVAGVVALMLEANPDLPAWRVKKILLETSKDLGDKGWDKDYGFGLLQALPAVKAAKKARR